jgi:orotidine-5'-phosphate decarboxylase
MSEGDNKARDRLCLALDVSSMEEADRIVSELSGKVGVFKVGLELFTNAGPKIVSLIKSRGGKVFVDLKFHDIPNTVAGAARAITRLGVTMLDVHASGGSEMMKATVEAVNEEAAKEGVAVPAVLAVTILTSLSAVVLRDELGVHASLEGQVVRLARLAQQNEIAGVVASPKETRLIREACVNVEPLKFY